MVKKSILLFLFFLAPPIWGQATFPGAEGAGAATAAGRGGTIIRVTNLNNSGAGSLRNCLEGTGTRICVCDVGGTVVTTSQININSGNLSFYGQTCPGGGLTVNGSGHSDQVILVNAPNVLIQYLTVRAGFNAGRSPSVCCSNFWLSGNTNNAILDHVSMSWAADENLTIWRASGLPGQFNLTFSWSILSEGFGTAIAIGCAAGTACADVQDDFDFHHNLMGWTSHRHPNGGGDTGRWVNNITYNWSFRAMQWEGGTDIDIINNVWKLGPMGNPSREINIWPAGLDVEASGDPSFYVVGNKGPNNSDPNADNWPTMIREFDTFNGPEIGQLSTQYRRFNPLAAQTYPITAIATNSVESQVLELVGNSRRLGCDGVWVMRRDAVDTRLINEYNAGTGISAVITNESQVGGFPTISGGTACTDTDGDGMFDLYETNNGLNPNNAADANTVAANGYRNIENFMQGQTPPPEQGQPQGGPTGKLP